MHPLVAQVAVALRYGKMLRESSAHARELAIVNEQLKHEITERKQAEERLRQQAIRDELTGLFNRRYLMEQGSLFIHSAKRYKHSLSLCLCDLDKFKSINDTYGHGVGDEVLATFSNFVQSEVRDADVAGRLGGDEFCLLFSWTAAGHAAISIERIRYRLENHVFQTKNGKRFSVTATFGIADLSPEDADMQDLMNAADQALYRAKELGRNQIVVNRL